METKRVSVAWLCFDREKKYQKNDIDYVKCNQPRCGAEFKLNPSTAMNLSRHVLQKHANLLPETKANKNHSKQMTLSFSRNQTIIPSFSQENFELYLTNLFVVQDLPFQLIFHQNFLQLRQSWIRG
jgi:ribosomal protein S19